MDTLLCWNKVEEYGRWREVFDVQMASQGDVGLRLADVWQSMDDPNMVHFIFDVSDPLKARGYLARPEHEEIGRRAGVLDGEIHFLRRLGI